MKRYTREQIKQVYADAKAIYNSYKGKAVKAYDGTMYDCFTWYNAIREAWHWLREAVRELAEQIASEVKEMGEAIKDEILQAAKPKGIPITSLSNPTDIINAIKALGLNHVQKFHIAKRYDYV